MNCGNISRGLCQTFAGEFCETASAGCVRAFSPRGYGPGYGPRSRYAGNFGAGQPTDRFVEALYSLVLHRTGSAAEVAAWGSALPAMGNQVAALAMLTSTECGADMVQSYFNGLLHRTDAPTAAEVNG
jgi:hypothetical protein